MTLTTQEAADLLGVSEARVRQLVMGGLLAPVKRNVRPLLFDEADVTELRFRRQSAEEGEGLDRLATAWSASNPARGSILASRPCTVELQPGVPCGTRSAERAPFPICAKHAIELHAHIEASHAEGVDLGGVRRDAPPRAPEKPACVYYLREGDGSIKIGFTTNMRARLAQLRLGGLALLATEPGGRDLERVRHLQFAALRYGRQEKFKAEDELMSHIEMLREHFGPPSLDAQLSA